MTANKLTIASGPVIIERGKVLLDKHGKDNFWKFPGGTMKHGETPESCARRQAKNELGIGVELVRPLKPVIIWKKNETMVLLHYLAKRKGKIKPARHVKEWSWIPVNNIPKDAGPNIKPVLKDLNN